MLSLNDKIIEVLIDKGVLLVDEIESNIIEIYGRNSISRLSIITTLSAGVGQYFLKHGKKWKINEDYVIKLKSRNNTYEQLKINCKKVIDSFLLASNAARSNTVFAIELRNNYKREIDSFISFIIKNEIKESDVRFFLKKFPIILHYINNDKEFHKYKLLQKTKEVKKTTDDNQDVESLKVIDKQISNFTDIENQPTSNQFSVNYDPSMQLKIKIDFEKKILFYKEKKYKELNVLFNDFLSNLIKERANHRSPEVDLFFENFEEFYE
jgi:hypothetical protein